MPGNEATRHASSPSQSLMRQASYGSSAPHLISCQPDETTAGCTTAACTEGIPCPMPSSAWQARAASDAGCPEDWWKDLSVPRRCDGFVQYSTSLFSEKGAIPKFPENKDRNCMLALPDSYQRDDDVSSLPLVVYLMFNNADGTTQWVTKTPTGGILNDRRVEPEEPWRHNQKALMHTLAALARSGCAVVMTSMVAVDTFYYLPDASKYGQTCSDYCWKDGANPDGEYFDELWQTLRSGELLSRLGVKGTRRVDCECAALIGYSVGAQMASTLLDASLRPWNRPLWPRFVCMVLVGGGSMYCYGYTGCCSDHQPPPPAFGECASEGMGCCPADWTESIFDDGVLPYWQHPPTLLLQFDEDPGADVEASWKYVSTLASRQAPGCIYTQKGGVHGMPFCAVGATVAFILRYVFSGTDDDNPVSGDTL